MTEQSLYLYSVQCREWVQSTSAKVGTFIVKYRIGNGEWDSVEYDRRFNHGCAENFTKINVLFRNSGETESYFGTRITVVPPRLPYP